MRLRHRRGSTLLLTMIVMMLTFTLGSVFLSLATQSLMRGRNDVLRAQALNLAEGGVEKAIFYLRGTAPDNSDDGSWRTAGHTETVAGVGDYTITVTDGAGDNAGKLVVEATGEATIGPKTVRRRLRAVVERTEEDVSPWNNVIFGGVGQTGRSINGNIVMRGSVHLLGDGEEYTDADNDGRWDDNEPYTDKDKDGAYDLGEPFTDTDGDGKRDARELWNDINGNGTRDAPLTITDLASEMSGDANIGNNYDGMPSTLSSRIPALGTRTVEEESGVQTINAKLRVRHGRVDISGSATIGEAQATGGTPLIKEQLDGVYVNDGFGGSAGTTQVYSDNGTGNKYDLAEIVKFPALTDKVTTGGTTYNTHSDYLAAAGLNITGDLTITHGVAGPTISDGKGNSLSVDANGNITISGIVHVNGNIIFNRSSGSGGGSTFRYTGRGTVYATGNIEVHANILSSGTFPTVDAMGFIARKELQLAQASGDSQLHLMGAFYAQNKIVSKKQNHIAGTFVSSYFEMQNVPHMYQVPSLPDNLPPGMPGSTPIWIVRTRVDSWRDLAPAAN